MKTQKPILVILRGLPGSGKSSLADELLKLPLFTGSLRLDPDQVAEADGMFQAFAKGLSDDIAPKQRVYRFLLRRAEKALREGQNVVWEQPWRLWWGIIITVENLTYFLTGHEDWRAAPFATAIVEVVIDLDEARQRVVKRFADGNHTLTEDGFEEFVGTLEPHEEVSNILFMPIDGTLPPTEAALLIASTIQNTFQERGLA